MANTPNLKKLYQDEVAPALMQKFGYKSTMQIPRLEKIVVNVGCSEARENAKVLDAVVNDLTTITGQKAVITKAKKSVANFKLREGMPIGAKVTLRGSKMWEFLDRLFNVALPRVRDFHGINPNSFDGRGNYALGIKEQLIFPEIEYDKIDKIRGMDIVVCTTAQTDEEARELPVRVIMPSFVTSELKEAFWIGFLLYIPFMLIDVIVSSTLMSMGMIMLPPSMISTPFKILLFILLDGWQLVFSTLVRTVN